MTARVIVALAVPLLSFAAGRASTPPPAPAPVVHVPTAPEQVDAVERLGARIRRDARLVARWQEIRARRDAWLVRHGRASRRPL